MEKREWLGLGIRLVGVFQLATAATYVMSLMDVIAKITPPSERSQWVGEGSALEYAFYAIAYIVLGIAFLRGADFLTEFAYPSQRPEDDEQLDSPANDLGKPDAAANYHDNRGH